MELMDLDKQEIAPFYRVKSILVGNQSVGKSSLMNMFTKSSHDPTITSTIGIDFSSFLYELKEYPLEGYLPNYYFEGVNQLEVKNKIYCQSLICQLWDASGSERFTTIVRSYLRDIDFAFLVFDMTNRQSWEDLIKWKKELESAAKYNRLPMLILVGTKADLYPHVITLDEINKRCKEWNAKNYIVSCVQQNSSSSIKRMLYKTISDFHENMILRIANEEIVPEHVTKYYYESRSPFIDIGAESSSGLCCTIV
jgi:Ras-related protein Rab-6A